MRMPGFTAEAALYKRPNRYLPIAEAANRPKKHEVIPQRNEVTCSADGCVCLFTVYTDDTGAWVWSDVYLIPC
jgi:hypothetical protein